MATVVLGCLLLLYVSSVLVPLFQAEYISNNHGSVVESLLSVVYWFPFYYTFKFVFLLWLALPTFRYVFVLSRFRFALQDQILTAITGAPTSSSALSCSPCSVATSLAPPLLVCAPRPASPSKGPDQILKTQERAWLLSYDWACARQR